MVLVQRWIDDELKERLSQYRLDRMLPTRVSVEMELLHGRARAKAKGSECYLVIARSATFPTIARLSSRGASPPTS